MDLEFEKINEIIKRYPETQGNLISIMQEVQSIYNYLPEKALRQLSKTTDIPVSQLFAIATFFHFFSLTPKGKHQVHVCTGTTCYVKGSSGVLCEVKEKLGVEEGKTTEDMKYSIDTVRCVGACSFAPVMVVDKDIHRNILNDEVCEILKKYK
jgi:NADH:ubiquinone oxidoreductase subunit E